MCPRFDHRISCSLQNKAPLRAKRNIGKCCFWAWHQRRLEKSARLQLKIDRANAAGSLTASSSPPPSSPPPLSSPSPPAHFALLSAVIRCRSSFLARRCCHRYSTVLFLAALSIFLPLHPLLFSLVMVSHRQPHLLQSRAARFSLTRLVPTWQTAPPPSVPVLLVTGATGKVGCAVVRSLLSVNL